MEMAEGMQEKEANGFSGLGRLRSVLVRAEKLLPRSSRTSRAGTPGRDGASRLDELDKGRPPGLLVGEGF